MAIPGSIQDREHGKFTEDDDGNIAVRVMMAGGSTSPSQSSPPAFEFILKTLFKDLSFDEVVQTTVGENSFYEFILSGNPVDGLTVVKIDNGYRYLRGIFVQDAILTEDAIQLGTEGGATIILEG